MENIMSTETTRSGRKVKVSEKFVQFEVRPEDSSVALAASTSSSAGVAPFSSFESGFQSTSNLQQSLSGGGQRAALSGQLLGARKKLQWLDGKLVEVIDQVPPPPPANQEADFKIDDIEPIDDEVNHMIRSGNAAAQPQLQFAINQVPANKQSSQPERNLIGQSHQQKLLITPRSATAESQHSHTTRQSHQQQHSGHESQLPHPSALLHFSLDRIQSRLLECSNSKSGEKSDGKHPIVTMNLTDVDPFGKQSWSGRSQSQSAGSAESAAAFSAALSSSTAPDSLSANQQLTATTTTTAATTAIGGVELSSSTANQTSGGGGKMKFSSDAADVQLNDLRNYNRISGYTLFSVANKKRMAASTASDLMGCGDVSEGGDPFANSSTAEMLIGGSSITSSSNTNIIGGSNSQSDPRIIQKRIQQLWTALPEKDRNDWKTRARKLQKQKDAAAANSSSSSSAAFASGGFALIGGGGGGEALAASKEVNQKQRTKLHAELARQQFTCGESLGLVELAGQMRLLGNGLQSLGKELIEKHRNTPIREQSVWETVLDAVLVSAVPLLSLINHVHPQLSESVSNEYLLESMNDFNFIVPHS